MIGTNFKSQKIKTEKLVCPFPIALLPFFPIVLLIFETNLITGFSFQTAGKFLPSRSEAEKLAGSDKRKFVYLPCSKGTFFLHSDKI